MKNILENKKMRRFQLILLLGALLVSCAKIKYTTREKRVEIFEHGGRNVEFSVIGRKNFYLWGHFPKDATVYIDEIVHQSTGYFDPAEISIEDFQSFPQFLASFFSIGLYTPRSYRIKGYAIRQRQYDQ